MTLSKQQIAQLTKIMESIQTLLSDAKTAPTTTKGSPSEKGTRRTGKDLLEFKKAIKKERKAGVPVSELASKYGVTPSYIYQLRD